MQDESHLVLFSLILASFVIIGVNASPSYGALYPNGLNVPCPSTSVVGCNETVGCYGVGHGNASTSYCGANAENGFVTGNTALINQFDNFGTQLNNNNFDWIRACKQDSDGDGQSNGLELGDPCCVWSIGKSPRTTTRSLISHPGNRDATTTASPCFGPDVVAPGKPGLPTIAPNPALTQTTGVLTWDPPTEGCYCGFEFEFDGEELENITRQNNVSNVFDLEGYIEASTNYTFRVRAVNLALDLPGEWSDTLVFETAAAGIPGRMDPPTGTVDVGSITLKWGEPTNNGGSNITRYVVIFDNAPSDRGNATMGTWDGLHRGTYVISIIPFNKFGSGVASIPIAFQVTDDASIAMMSMWLLAGIAMLVM